MSLVRGLDGREIEFAQNLASNTLKVRNKTIAKLQKFVSTLDEDTLEDDELMKLWKGLFYCMWMSDKPKVQQELALTIASLLHYFPSPASSLQFLRCFILTMNREWHGIDNLRLNKFYSLQRRMVEESLKIAISDIFNKTKEGEEKEVVEEEEEEEEFTEQESDNIFLWGSCICESLEEGSCPAVVLHFADVFVDSLEKVMPQVQPGDQILSDLEMNGFLIPFYDLLQSTNDVRVARRVTDDVFRRILNATFDTEFSADQLDEEDFASDLERHNFILSGTHRYFPYFDGIEQALLSLATSADTRDQNRTFIFDLQDRYQKIRVPKREEERKRVEYNPITSIEASLLKKRKGKKKRKKPATKKIRHT